MHRSEESACQDQIGEAKQREQLGVVLRQVAIARLAMLEQALHDMKAMLDLRAHAGFGLLELLLGSAQWIFLERLAHARMHRNVPVDCLVRVFRTLANALVASVAFSPPCRSACVWVTSATLPAVPTTDCTRPVAMSTPTRAFMPKCQSFPFFDWCISGSRSLSRFFVDGGAEINVASTIVPSRMPNTIFPCRQLSPTSGQAR